MRTLKLILSFTLLLPVLACTDELPALGGNSAGNDGAASESDTFGDGDQDAGGSQEAGDSGDEGESTSGGGSGGATGDGDGAGVCAQGCVEDDDCCPIGAFNCPSENYPNNYSCNDQGVCEFGGCKNDDDCGGVLSNLECHSIDGTPTCFEPCVNNTDCLLLLGTTCSGMSDDGESYCALAPPPPCEDDGDCGGRGLCDIESGDCYCTADSNCNGNQLDTCAFD